MVTTAVCVGTATLAGALLLGACSDVVVIAPVIDGPPPGSAAAAFPDLDTIELSIALAGEPDDLVTASFKRGEQLELPGVPYGENLVIHMIGRLDGAEVAAGRTCPFAVRTGEAPPSPHLYFARTSKWATAGTPPSALRDGATALTDRDGSGLYIGGVDPGAIPIVGVDRFDTANGRFEELASVVPRRNGAAAQLGDGRIVIGGGTAQNGQPVAVLELLTVESATGARVEVIPDSPLVGHSAPAFVSLSDGRVVAFGGSDAASAPIGQLVEITPDGAGVTQRVLQRAALAIPRKGHTATRLTDDLGAPVLLLGGLDAANQPVARAELYKPLLEEMAPAGQFAPLMRMPRHNHEAVRLPDGSVLIVGGLDASGVPVRTLELFTFDSGFVEAGTLPLTAGIIDFSVTTLPDGRILIAGGRDAFNNPVATTFVVRLDPLGGGIDIVTTDRLATPRTRHQATLLCDGTVMLLGGTLIAAPSERYNPPAAGRR
ncbi:MAG: hypothetical protein H0X17_06900 [Deltaproteobacteria bacterium]|nr:hypothetical protein [Deltaproteobacteria bacterium]